MKPTVLKRCLSCRNGIQIERLRRGIEKRLQNNTDRCKKRRKKFLKPLFEPSPSGVTQQQLVRPFSWTQVERYVGVRPKQYPGPTTHKRLSLLAARQLTSHTAQQPQSEVKNSSSHEKGQFCLCKRQPSGCRGPEPSHHLSPCVDCSHLAKTWDSEKLHSTINDSKKELYTVDQRTLSPK